MGIRHKSFLYILAVVLFNLGVVGVIVVMNYCETEERQFSIRRAELEKAMTAQYKQHGQDLAHAIGEAIINPIFLNEYEEVDRLVSSFASQPVLSAIYAFDANMRVVSDGLGGALNRGDSISDRLGFEVEMTNAMMNKDGAWYIVHPIFMEGGYPVGGLVVVISLAPMHRALENIELSMSRLRESAFKDQLQFFILSLPIVMLIALLVSFLASGNIAHPIRKISAEVGRMEKQEYDIDLPTERKDEIGELSRSIEDLATILNENKQFKDNLISSVSHELRTPLTSVRGFPSIIRRDLEKVFRECDFSGGDGTSEKKIRRIRDNLTIIEQEGERLTRLANNILDLKKIESGKMVWRFTRTSPASILRRATDAMQGLFVLNSAYKYEIQIPSDLPDVVVDSDRIEQVVVNLISNAVKYSDGGTVSVHASEVEGGLVQVDVRDNGEGVPESMRKYIFQRFQQVSDHGRQQAKGSGLGLSICREIVGEHGGTIWVTDNSPKGSRFSFTMPVFRV